MNESSPFIFKHDKNLTFLKLYLNLNISSWLQDRYDVNVNNKTYQPN